MATFPEQDSREAAISPMMAYIEAHPEEYRQLMHDYNEAWRQLGARDTLDAESEETISRLADTLLERNRAMFQALTQASTTQEESSPTTAVLGEMMDEKVQAMLTPAQHYFLKCLGTAADEMRAA